MSWLRWLMMQLLVGALVCRGHNIYSISAGNKASYTDTSQCCYTMTHDHQTDNLVHKGHHAFINNIGVISQKHHTIFTTSNMIKPAFHQWKQNANTSHHAGEYAIWWSELQATVVTAQGLKYHSNFISLRPHLYAEYIFQT